MKKIKIVALGNKITKEQLGMAYKLIESAFVELKPEISIVDLHTHKVPVGIGSSGQTSGRQVDTTQGNSLIDLVLAFGPKSKSLAGSIKLLEIPPLSSLMKATGSKEVRVHTFELLKLAAADLLEATKHTTITVSAKEFAQLTMEDLPNLLTGSGYIDCKLSTGQSLRVWAAEPLDNSADINITLDELKIIKFMSKDLGLGSVNIKAKINSAKSIRREDD